jgi:hypothetical protein
MIMKGFVDEKVSEKFSKDVYKKSAEEVEMMSSGLIEVDEESLKDKSEKLAACIILAFFLTKGI